MHFELAFKCGLRGDDSVIITGNLLVNEDTATYAVISLSEVNNRQVTHALVTNNLCFARIALGIQCISTNDVAIQGNMIVATGACNHAILVRSQSSAVEDISIRDNALQSEIATIQLKIRANGRVESSSPPNHMKSARFPSPEIPFAVQSRGLFFMIPVFRKTPVLRKHRCALSTGLAMM